MLILFGVLSYHLGTGEVNHHHPAYDFFVGAKNKHHLLL